MMLRRLLKVDLLPSLRVISSRCCSSGTENVNVSDPSSQKAGGFHQAFIKYTQVEENLGKPDEPFASLIRRSSFIDLGDIKGKIVTGTIFHIVNDDLYIDFGGKFHCVCTRPSKNGHLYRRGSVVKLKLKELELSTRFLGSEKDLSLLEADADIVALVTTPKNTQQDPV